MEFEKVSFSSTCKSLSRKYGPNVTDCTGWDKYNPIQLIELFSEIDDQMHHSASLNKAFYLKTRVSRRVGGGGLT